MKKKYIIFGTAAALIILGILFFWWQKGNKQYEVSHAIASNIQRPYFADKETLYYFSGSSFVKYDLKNYKTENLVPIKSLPDITEIKWAPQGVLFKAGAYTPADDLYRTIQEQDLPLDQYYWWFTDFNTKTTSLVGDASASQLMAGVSWLHDYSGYLYVLRPYGDEESGLIQTVGSNPSSARINVATTDEDLNIVWANRNKIIFEVANDKSSINLEEIDYKANRRNVILQEIGGAVESSARGDGFTYIKDVDLEEVETIRGDLYYFNPLAKKNTLVAKDFSGRSQWSEKLQGFTVYGNTRKDNVLILFIPQGKTTYRTSDDKEKFFYSVNVASLNPLMMHGVDDNGLLYALSDRPLKQLPNIPSYSPIQKDIYEDGFNINYFSKNNRYNIYITSEPYSAYQLKALDFIKSKGIDPSQVNIKWYADDGIDRTN